MERRYILAILCLISSFISCGGGGSNEPSQETINGACGVVGLPTKIIGGVTCSGLDTSPIVRVAAFVRVAGQEVPIPICTGTLISSKDVLTATHCVNSSDLGGRTISGYGVIAGEAGDAVLYRASEPLVAPGLDVVDGRLINDLAVLRLETAPSLSVMPVLISRKARKGETGFVYGYGLQEVAGDSQTNNFVSLQGGAMRINAVGDEFIQARFNGNGTNVCNGDSGGPMIIQEKAGPAIVGIVSQGSVEGCRTGDVTSFTSLAKPALISWLTSVVPDVSVR